MPSTGIEARQTAANLIWFRSTDSPMGYSLPRASDDCDTTPASLEADSIGEALAADFSILRWLPTGLVSTLKSSTAATEARMITLAAGPIQRLIICIRSSSQFATSSRGLVEKLGRSSGHETRRPEAGAAEGADCCSLSLRLASVF